MKSNIALKSLVLTLLLSFAVMGSTFAQGGARYVDLTDAAEHSVQAVTYIKTEFVQKNSLWDDFFSGSFWDNFFGSAPSNIYPHNALTYAPQSSSFIIFIAL